MFESLRWALVICTVGLVSASIAAQDAAEGEPVKAETAESGDQETAEPEKKAEVPPASETEGQVPTGVPPAAAAKSTGTSTGAYTVRLRDLEDRVNRLKEQIFRSKARLSLLAETVLDRKIAGAKATIVFRNEMGGSFRLVKASFLLDGAPIFNKSDEGESLADRDVINLFDGPVMPGDHILSAVLHFRGHGYGIFSYLKGYSFKTRSSRTFTVTEGKALRLEVVGYEKGGATTPLEERPDVRYVMNTADYEGGAAPQGDAKESPEAQE
ncbi:MAG: hypothetical protein QNJ97_02245 [Myxococcota bacterium]|nr:hypothetical protein [Myxococcota bacterium]